MPKLSIVIPAYNEEEIIADSLYALKREIKKDNLKAEIIVVDDGSRDKTAKIVKNTSGVRLIKMKDNSGKGAALREGMLSAKGEKIIFMDADLSVPLKFIPVMYQKLNNYDVVIGTRRVEQSKIVVHQPWIRETLGRIFTKLTQIMTSTNLSDYTCGFKGFTRDSAQKIFSSAVIDRWAYDSEIMFLAGKYKYKIHELPVEWYNRAESRVDMKSAIITSLRDLFFIRFNNLTGKYAEK